MHDRVVGQKNLILEDLDSASFAAKINNDKNAVIIDVRTQMEYNEGHLAGSLLIDISSPSFMDEIEKLDRSKSYYIYCRSGNRSWHAGNYMLKQGFPTVAHLRPGIIGWHGPIEK
jgi:rhodanese-related sulfurtransferase